VLEHEQDEKDREVKVKRNRQCEEGEDNESSQKEKRDKGSGKEDSKEHKNTFKIATWNVRGLTGASISRHELIDLSIKHELDIMILTETKYTQGSNTYHTKKALAGYKIYQSSVPDRHEERESISEVKEDWNKRHEGAKGGVIIAINKDIAGAGATEMVKIPQELWGNLCGVKLSTNKKEGKLWVWGVYITPGKENIRKQVYDYITECKRKGERHIIAGDFNARLYDEDYNGKRRDNKQPTGADQRHQDFVEENNLFTIKEDSGRAHTYCRDGGTSENVYTSRIDDILYSNETKDKVTMTVLDNMAGSDHLPIITTWDKHELGVLIQPGKGHGGLYEGGRNKLAGIGEKEKKKIQEDIQSYNYVSINNWTQDIKDWSKKEPTEMEVDKHVDAITQIMQSYQRRANNIKEGREPGIEQEKSKKHKPNRSISRPLHGIFLKIKSINKKLNDIRKGREESSQDIKHDKEDDQQEEVYKKCITKVMRLRATVRYQYQKDRKQEAKVARQKDITTFDKSR